ncbi:unnamed protein product, partial [marine sediment metagenome]
MSHHTKKYKKKEILKSLSLSFNESNLMSYQDIKDKILPFDLIACRGGDILSDLIDVMESKQVGMGTFSHVGMIVTSDILPRCIVDDGYYYLEKNKHYILESTFSYTIKGITDYLPDVTTNEGKFGVQLRDFEELIPTYITNEKTKVAWCKLMNNPYMMNPNDTDDTLLERREILKCQFMKFFEDYHQRLYEIDALGLFGAMFPSLRLVRDMKDDVCKHLFKTLNKYKLTNSV